MARVHPGFANVAAGISAKEHVPPAEANAILASASRHASPAAKSHNPRLNRVSGAESKRVENSAADKAADRRMHLREGSPADMAQDKALEDSMDPRHTTPHPSLPGRSMSGRMLPTSTNAGLPKEPQYFAAPVPKVPKGY